MFDVDIRLLSYDARDFTIVDIGDAIRETKRYLETGSFLPVLVSKMDNGRYKLRTSIVTYFVAHCLEVPTIPVQEIKS